MDIPKITIQFLYVKCMCVVCGIEWSNKWQRLTGGQIMEGHANFINLYSA